VLQLKVREMKAAARKRGEPEPVIMRQEIFVPRPVARALPVLPNRWRERRYLLCHE
jgi:hypothetical protein